MANQGVWDYTDLQNRYERAQLLANDCTTDFAGNYFFPSDRSPRGFWITTRRQRLDYVCDCPDFARLIDQQITSFAPSRWVRGDWSTNPDNRILVNRCLHCFAVAIAEQELDPNFPINRIYTSRRSRFPKTDCGCGCGGSGDCGCPSKVLGIPEPRLIQGCETGCYVEPLTPRTQRTPSTTEGIPAYQTFEIPTIEFAQTRYQGCFGESVTIQLKRNTSLGFNNATVVGLPTDIEFPFEPEFRTSSKQVTLDFFAPGIYTIGIGAIAAGNFGDALEAQIEIVDCGNDLDNIDCPPQGFVDFSDGYCEGSYFVAFRQTGNKNPDGSCEILKVLDFQEGLDCPIPEDPSRECESTIPADCTPTPISPPACVNTSAGDGFNSNAGFNAVVRVRTGRKKTEYLRPDRKECREDCEFAEITVNSPSCPEPPTKPPEAPTCGYAKRYLGWEKFDPSTGSYRNIQTGADNSSSVGTAIAETFTCDDGTIYGLRAYTARCVPPSNRVLDDFAAANYQGNEFGEGCCPFDETKPERPACPPKPPEPILKWSCSGGVCSPDVNGSYNSQAECEAALIPPPFTGGQCNFAYVYVLTRTGGTVGTRYIGLVNATNGTTTVPLTTVSDAIAGARGGVNQDVYKPTGITSIVTVGATTTVTVGFERPLGSSTTQGIPLPANDGFPTFNPYTYSMQGVYPLDPADIDNCGDLPSTCP